MSRSDSTADLMKPLSAGYRADPTLSAYAARLGLESGVFLADGSMSLIYDGRYRLWFRALPAGHIVMESVLMELTPIPPSMAQEVMVRVLRYASSTARAYACGLVLDDASNRLLLQQIVPCPVSAASFEEDLAEFLNVLGFWLDICAQEDKRLNGPRGER